MSIERRARGVGSALGLALVSAVAPTHAAERTCAEVLTLAGPEVATAELGAALRRGVLADVPGARCSDATLALEVVPGGYRVTMTLGAERVERVVAEPADAAAWVESWLVPAAEDAERQTAAPDEAATPPGAATEPEIAPPPSATVEAVATAPAPDPTGPARMLAVAGHVGLAPTVAVGEDSSVWGGAEALVQVTVDDAAWLGVGFAGLIDTVLTDDSAAGDDLRRRLLRATMRGGGRVRLAPSAALDLGLGIGLVSALAHHEREGAPTIVDSEGAFVAEGLATLLLSPTRRVWLFVGLSGGGIAALEGSEAGETDDFATLPAAHPKFLGGVTLGAALGWQAGE